MSTYAEINTNELTLLYVEDDNYIVDHTVILLEKLFKKVFVAANGKLGLESFIKYQDEIDVIITDIKMPELDGIAMCSKIREINSDIPILFTTAYSDKEYLISAIKIHISSYILKPFKLLHLISKIKEAYYPIFQNIKLAEKTNALNDFIKSSTDFMWEVDSKGVYTYASEGAVNILGYTADEIIGKTPFHFMDEQDTYKIFEIFNKIVKEESNIKDLVNWNISKNGKKVCLLTNGVPIFSKNGELKGYRGTDKDITENIYLQKELKDQSTLIRDVLNAQSSFTLLTDGKYLILANQTMLDFFGYKTLEEFHKEHDCICDFFLEEEGYLAKEVNGKNWFEAILEDLNVVHKVKMLSLDKKEHIYYINTKGIGFDKKDHYVVAFTDVTNLERLNEEKNKKEKQLAEHLKMASMGTMIGNIAHQWRQPLTTITTLASGMQLYKDMGTLTDEFLNESLQEIADLSMYLSDTINTFRNYLMETKAFRKIILQDRIDLALKITNAALKDNNIKLINNIDYSIPIKISLVLGEFIEVIINIIINAKDALVERKIKKPWIRIELTKAEDKVMLTIEDNGGGISDDIMHKIFDEYFTTKDTDIGTGVGLHMSYKIITESLNGKLYTENTENGAKFYIELPLYQDNK